MSFKTLTDEQVIDTAISYVKHEHPIPDEIKLRLIALGLLHIVDPFGDNDD